AAEDDALLRQLDVDDQHPYPVKRHDLEHVVALIEASPQSLSSRMALVEARLTGKNKLVLTAHPSDLATRVTKLAHVEEARLWELPFEYWRWQAGLNEDEARTAVREMTIFHAVPSLMKGRILYFKGDYDGDKGAKRQLLGARPSDTSIDNYKLPAETAKMLKPEGVSQEEAARTVLMRRAKQQASLTLGQIFYEQKDYANAIDMLAHRTPSRSGLWTPLVQYDLARVYEANNEMKKAIAIYESDVTSDQSQGSHLRARWLKAGVLKPAGAPPLSPAATSSAAEP
ncbi:MAG TPA: hypothetical protein VHV08_17110, partial [Pirellulales bacterium]|nr:hypothetical protein [Pirellulales bacterium]